MMNKNELDALLASHEMTSHLLSPTVSDAAMLATIVQMVQDGKDEMALYVLHNIKPHALKLAEEPEEEEDEKPTFGVEDIDELLDIIGSALLG